MATGTLDHGLWETSAASAAPSVERARSARRGTAIGMLLVFVVAFAVYWVSPVRMQTDSFWVSMTARSLVAHGDVDLDEYATLIRLNHSFQIERRDGHRYYAVPLATSLTAVPVAALASVVAFLA